MEKKYFSGFTLVELLIVISIIAILAALVVVNFTGQVLKSNDAKRKSNIQRIQVAVEEYEKDNNCYPVEEKMKFCGSNSSSSAIYPYLSNIPCDLDGKPFRYVNDPSNSACPVWYKIYTSLQNTKDPSVIPDIGPDEAYNYVQGSANAPPDTAGATEATGTPSTTTTPIPTGPVNEPYYGCINGVCVQVAWDSTRHSPVCAPNYQNPTCYYLCGNANNACVSRK